MSDMKKLNDEALENVTGGARRTVSNDSSSYSWVRSGPGKQYDEQYKVYRSLGIDIASTTGMNKDHLQRLFRQLLFFCRLPSVDIHNRSKEH